MAKNIIKSSDVEQVAKLSRLEFSPSEIELLKRDLGDIVEYFGSLSSVDVTKIKEVAKHSGTPREDEVKMSMNTTDVIKNAPEHNHNSFIVPKVVD